MFWENNYSGEGMGLNFRRGFQRAAPHLASLAMKLANILIPVAIFAAVIFCIVLFKQDATYMDYKIWKAVALCIAAAVYGFWRGANPK